MDFKKCSRCGNFYTSPGEVCPNCNSKEVFERSAFKSYIEQNGLNGSISAISKETRNFRETLT